jgi:large conductance mechanosensitive channel
VTGPLGEARITLRVGWHPTDEEADLLKEFKEFSLKGNVLDVAVGLVLALAFTTVVNAFINGVIMPFVAAIFGEPNFDAIVIHVGDGVIAIGTFITAVVNFLIIAWVLFLIVKAANRFRKPAETAGPTEVELLTQIRDSLADQTS